jgi:tRNA threonylcarbamoyladenosine biosynthesis protein TsaB
MILAIDTATPNLSVALHDGVQILSERTWHTANRHTVELAPTVHTMLGEQSKRITDVTAIAVAQGPGSFNGLRVGISFAKGLAVALNVPVYPIPTLDIVAYAQPPADHALIAVALAGRGRVVAGGYQYRDGAWHGRDDVRIVAWDALLNTLTNALTNALTEKTIIAGEIDSAARALIDAHPMALAANPANCLRRAGYLAELAVQRFQIEGALLPDLASLAPLYLHQPGVPHP